MVDITVSIALDKAIKGMSAEDAAEYAVSQLTPEQICQYARELDMTIADIKEYVLAQVKLELATLAEIGE